MTFFLGIGVLLVWLVMRQLSDRDKQDIVDAFHATNYTWIFLTIVLNIASNLSRSMRWQMLIKSSGYHASLLNTFSALMIGYLMNYAVPRLGEVTRCGVLNKHENVPVSASLGTVVLERIVDLLSLAVLLLITIIWKYELIAGFLSDLQSKMFGADGGSSLKVILGTTVLLTGTCAYLLRQRLAKNPVFMKIIGFIKGFWTGLASIKDLEKPWLFLFHSIFIWTMYIMMLYFGFFALPQTANLPFDASLVALVFGTFGMILVQGGIGAYPVMVSQALVLYGVTSSIGFAFGWLAWVSQTLIYLVVGFLALIFIPVINQRRNVRS